MNARKTKTHVVKFVRISLELTAAHVLMVQIQIVTVNALFFPIPLFNHDKAT